MNLHYEVRNDNGYEYCVTPCTLGKKTMNIARIMIGSENCPHCRRYQFDDKENQILTCTCDKVLKPEQIKELKEKGIAV